MHPKNEYLCSFWGGRGLLVAGRRYNTVGCWRTGHGGHRPTMVTIAIPCLPSPSCVCHRHPVFASVTIVGRWSPCPVLPTITVLVYLLMAWWVAGGRGTEATVLLWLPSPSRVFLRPTLICKFPCQLVNSSTVHIYIIRCNLLVPRLLSTRLL